MVTVIFVMLAPVWSCDVWSRAALMLPAMVGAGVEHMVF